MMLVLDVEYLAGVSFAAIGPESPTPDWPPQPDRIFSALVATWAARGKREEEASALEWLEAQPVQGLIEAGAFARTAPTVYVPPNDPRSGRSKSALGVVPAFRPRQPRRFPAARPVDPLVRLLWSAVPPPNILAALQALAHDTAYIGHSSSLTRCCFLIERSPLGQTIREAGRSVYPGRFRELCDAYARFESSAARKDRPQKGAVVLRPNEAGAPRRNVFGDRWLILEHVAGAMPDVRTCALVARTIRDTILCGYRRIGLGEIIPEVLSGHAPDGKPTRLPHIAIVPLAFVGHPYADGHVLGFALVPPSSTTILDNDDFRTALRGLAPLDEERGRRVLTVTARQGSPAEQAFSIQLSPSFESARRSLDPGLYLGPARTFATATPIVLDRHLKTQGQAREAEIRLQIVAACRRLGLPEPEEVLTNRHSALEGAPSAYPFAKSPQWLRWRLPPALASRQLTHAVVRFSEPAEGPLLIGAGRFLGLGFCRPLDRVS